MQWIRYAAGTLMAISGLGQFFTGCMSYNGLYIVLGIAVVAAGCYIGFAPAVYFFARRQQERRSAAWAVIVAGCFAIATALIVVSLFAFLALKASWENDCREFAHVAFDRMFVEHDATFLAEHSTASVKDMPAEQLIGAVDDQLGGLDNVDAPMIQIRSRLAWPALQIDALAAWHASFANAPRTTIWMRLSGSRGDWRVEHVRWQYQ